MSQRHDRKSTRSTKFRRRNRHSLRSTNLATIVLYAIKKDLIDGFNSNVELFKIDGDFGSHNEVCHQEFVWVKIYIRDSVKTTKEKVVYKGAVVSQRMKGSFIKNHCVQIAATKISDEIVRTDGQFSITVGPEYEILNLLEIREAVSKLQSDANSGILNIVQRNVSRLITSIKASFWVTLNVLLSFVPRLYRAEPVYKVRLSDLVVWLVEDATPFRSLILWLEKKHEDGWCFKNISTKTIYLTDDGLQFDNLEAFRSYREEDQLEDFDNLVSALKEASKKFQWKTSGSNQGEQEFVHLLKELSRKDLTLAHLASRIKDHPSLLSRLESGSIIREIVRFFEKPEKKFADEKDKSTVNKVLAKLKSAPAAPTFEIWRSEEKIGKEFFKCLNHIAKEFSPKANVKPSGNLKTMMKQIRNTVSLGLLQLFVYK